MERILRLFGKEYGNLNQAAILLGSFTFLSQILGLFRDRAIAHFIGPSLDLDIYYAAFRIPDFIFLSFASLFSITVLIPFILDKMKGSQSVTKDAIDFINNVFSFFILLLFVVSVFAFFLMPYLVKFITPGFNSLAQTKIVLMSQIMLLSPVFLGLSNLFGSITQLFKKFFIYSLSPIFYNLGIILGIVFLYPVFGIFGLAIGVVGGAILHFLIQFLSSQTSGFKTSFIYNISFKEIKNVVAISLPRTLGLSINNIVLIIIVSIASFLPFGSISVYNLSLNIQNVPLSIIGLSYAVAAFPNMSRFFKNGDLDSFKNNLIQGARQIIFWSLPIAFLFIVLRAQIVRVILGTPTFSWDNTRLVAASLALFSISIVAQSLIALFARAYYAGGNTKKPLYINLISATLIIIFAKVLIFVFNTNQTFRFFIEHILKVDSISGTGILMLPFAYSLGTIINFILLWYFIKKDFMQGRHFILESFLQSLTASFALGLVTYFALNAFSPIFVTETFFGIFLQGLLAGICGILAGAVVFYIFKNEEFLSLIRTLRTKFWKNKVLPPSEENI
ncbi:MAG: murein biosynthesis integral membrane protein MurJ [Candidatus Pacebacteria bacterium]|jgi:putative peptidoglycan lipid II flippase|nr:murein biosynthesis integral membrane protein MurJ [Candidatus Paceibacterota bacterium]